MTDVTTVVPPDTNTPTYAYLEKPTWKIRRRVIFLSLMYIAGNLEFIIIKGTDSALYAQVALGLLAAGTSIIATYVFGANWDTSSFNNMLAAAQGIRTGNSSSGNNSSLVAVPIVNKPATIVNNDSATAVKNNPVPPKKDDEED